jgi:hypothetical protein
VLNDGVAEGVTLMAPDAGELRDALIAAAKRHDEMLAAYRRVTSDLFHEIVRAAGPLQGDMRIFQGRTETEGDLMAFVIKSNLTSKDHAIGRRVLTFQTSGLGYHPASGALCGFVQVILGSEDYWGLLKKRESIEGISRKVIDLLWTYADSPGVWFRRNRDGAEQQLVMSDYLFRLLDTIYNPEHKEWTVTPDDERELPF